MIGLYAIVADAPRQAAGSRGEPLQTIQLEGFSALAGEAPPPLSVESLRAHEAAVRRIAEAVEACLPARFGAAASDEETRQALALVRGREQMTRRIHGPGAATAALSAKEGGAGTRYLEERRRARQLPEIDPLRRALAGLVRAERIERHSEPGLLASVYHLIDRGAAPAYARAIGEIPLEELRVAVSGPWPAWSFAPEVALP